MRRLAGEQSPDRSGVGNGEPILLPRVEQEQRHPVVEEIEPIAKGGPRRTLPVAGFGIEFAERSRVNEWKGAIRAEQPEEVTDHRRDASPGIPDQPGNVALAVAVPSRLPAAGTSAGESAGGGDGLAMA